MNDAGTRLTVVAAGIPFSAIAWGDPAARPLLLVHGVTASAAGWWRVGPALAGTRRRVVAVDLPGHGRTGHWTSRARFQQTAEDLAEFIRIAGLATPDLQIVAHSWGAMVAVGLPAAGIHPARLVLLDPPSLSLSQIVAEATAAHPAPSSSPEAARLAVVAEHPGWPEGDQDAAVEAALGADLGAAQAVLFGNGDWDSGLAALAQTDAAGLDVWVVRGDPTAGGHTPDEVAAAFADRYGADHVLSIAGAPHSPQPTHPDELIAALLRALDAT
jgi:pimeloyl-ACP methyl ester carboxylesterase